MFKVDLICLNHIEHRQIEKNLFDKLKALREYIEKRRIHNSLTLNLQRCTDSRLTKTLTEFSCRQQVDLELIQLGVQRGRRANHLRQCNRCQVSVSLLTFCPIPLQIS